eukprot:5465099-Pleurochrysis_carterae.AAC.2
MAGVCQRSLVCVRIFTCSRIDARAGKPRARVHVRVRMGMFGCAPARAHARVHEFARAPLSGRTTARAPCTTACRSGPTSTRCPAPPARARSAEPLDRPAARARARTAASLARRTHCARTRCLCCAFEVGVSRERRCRLSLTLVRTARRTALLASARCARQERASRGLTRRAVFATFCGKKKPARDGKFSTRQRRDRGAACRSTRTPIQIRRKDEAAALRWRTVR